MNKLVFISFLLVTTVFFSCETDIDVNAEPTDITIVYGIINPDADTHYVKINKAFLGEGSANDLAGNASNYDYAAGELEVTMEGGGNSYSLTRVTNEVPKDVGLFDNSTNVLYRFIEPGIDRNSVYTLKIKNSKLDKEVSSSTGIVGGTDVSTPRPNSKIGLWNGDINTGLYLPLNVKMNTGDNIGRVAAYLSFNYTEFYRISSGKSEVSKNVIMSLGEEFTSSIFGGETIEWTLNGENFFDNLSSSVSLPSSVNDFSHRRLDNISMEFVMAGTELSTFMSVSAPSSSVNQDKPKYTNIKNGIGMFSSRSNLVWISSVTPSSGNVNISPSTIAKLETLNLGFCFGSGSTAKAPCVHLP